MLDVDAAFGQPEVRPIWTAGVFRERAFIWGLVLVRDPVAVEPVGDLPFFKAFDEVAVQRAQLMGLDPSIVAILGLEVPLALVRPVELGEPIQNQFPEPGFGGDLVEENVSEERAEFGVIAGVIGQGRNLCPQPRE